MAAICDVFGLFLHSGDHFLSPDRIDQIVSAEFPDPINNINKGLMEAITSTMVHGSCGDLLLFRPQSPFTDLHL